MQVFRVPGSTRQVPARLYHLFWNHPARTQSIASFSGCLPACPCFHKVQNLPLWSNWEGSIRNTVSLRMESNPILFLYYISRMICIYRYLPLPCEQNTVIYTQFWPFFKTHCYLICYLQCFVKHACNTYRHIVAFSPFHLLQIFRAEKLLAVL